MLKLSQKISDYTSTGDSISLAALNEKSFTIKSVEQTSYDGKPSVKIGTVEKFKGSDLTLTEKAKTMMTDKAIEEFPKGTYDKFHSSRITIVNALQSEKLQADLKKGPIGPMKCEFVKNPKRGGNPYWILVDA